MYIKDWGIADYKDTYIAMQNFTKKRNQNNDINDELWIVEHNAVYTFGQAGKEEHLLNNNFCIPIYKTDRGGQITFHGKGQIVIYLLLNLHRLKIYVRELVFKIEQAIINTLSIYNIDSLRQENAPGIYVTFQNKISKIAALGLKVSRGFSYHGLALNVNMDLLPFLDINPCGYAGLKTIDMKTLLNYDLNYNQVKNSLVDNLILNLK